MPLQHRSANLPSTSTADGQALVGLMVPLALGTVFVLGRSYSRLFIVSSWGLDDTSIIAAWISTLACVILMTFSTNYGSAIPKSCSIFHYSANIFYFVALFLTKISILFFYLRILPPGNSSSRGDRTCLRRKLWAPRLLTQITIVLVTSYSIPLLIGSALSCTPDPPRRFLFNPTITCVPFLPLLTANAVLSALTDLWLLAIIVPCILRLQLMRPRQKASLVVLFASTGLLVVAAGVLRVVEIAGTVASKPVAQWNVDAFEIWSAVELCLGLVCASLPGWVPLLRNIAPGVMGSIMGDSYKSSGGGGANAAAAVVDAWTGYTASSKSRCGGDKDGMVLELHGGSRNQSVIRSFAKGGKPAARFGARASTKKKVGWYGGGGWAESEKKIGSSRRQADNESQEDVLSSREESDGLRPDTGIVKTSEVVITESRAHGSDDDWP